MAGANCGSIARGVWSSSGSQMKGAVTNNSSSKRDKPRKSKHVPKK